MIQQFYPGYLSEESKNTNLKKICAHLGLMQDYLQQLRYGSNLSARQQMNGVFIYSEILFSRKEEGNSAICYNMDTPGVQDRERQIQYDFIYICNLEKEQTVV